MSFAAIPQAPPPPTPMRVHLLPQTSPLTFKQQLLLEGLKIHKHRTHEGDIPMAPPPPRPMMVKSGTMSRPFKDLLYMGAENLRQRTRSRGLAPPPPPPMKLRTSPMQPMEFKLMIAQAAGDMKHHLMHRSRLDAEKATRSAQTALAPPPPPPPLVLLKSAPVQPMPFKLLIAQGAENMLRRSHAGGARTAAASGHYPPSPPPRPEPLMVRSPIDHPIGEDVARVAMQMREEHYPPRAPAAPAPEHVQGPPLWHPIKEDIEKAATHMHETHVPPSAPAPPAPMTVRWKLSTVTLKDELALAVAGRQQRTEGVTKRAIPLAPPPPAPYRFRPMPVARTLGDELPHAVTKVMASRRMAAQPRQHLRRSMGPTMERPLEGAEREVPLGPRSASAETVPAVHVPGPLMHEAERVINHRPLVEKEVIKEHPIEVQVERHIQPVVHETIHQIQPVIKTEVTADTMVVVKDTNVILPAIVETPIVIEAAPVRTAAVATPLPVGTGVGMTTAVPIVHPAGMGGLDSEQPLTPGVVAPMMPGEHEVRLQGVRAHDDRGLGLGATSPTAAGGRRRGSIGMKIKGALKEVQGTITRNPAKKEEGRMLLHGVDPSTASSTSSNRT